MIKTVAVDLGGVLFSNGTSVVAERLSRESGYDKDVILGVLSSPKGTGWRKGLMRDDQFWAWAKGRFPENYDLSLIKKEWWESYLLDQGVFRLIRKLKRRYRMIAFSGNVKNRVEFLDRKYGFRKLFDAEVYSFDYQLMKPDQRFVMAMIKEAGCRPEEIAYIDDIEEYLTAAKILGVKTILYQKGKIRELEEQLRRGGVEI